ncbi:amidohydrolase family protein [Deltaproteobacteria bacterium TL4]
MDQVGIDRIVLIPAMNDPLPETPDTLLAIIRQLMLRKSTRHWAEWVHRTLLTPEGDLRLNQNIYQIYHHPDNESIHRIIQKYPDRFLGWIFLNPRNNPKVIEELEYWRQQPGMIGVKLHPHWHDYRVELLFALLSRVEALQLPVLIHLGFGKRGAYRQLAEKFPNLKIISAHAGFPFFKEFWDFSKQHRNLYVDLSSPYLNESLVRAAVKKLGSERCIYGTDSPYGFNSQDHSYDYKVIKEWIERLPLSSKAQGQILGDNFRELLQNGGYVL